MSNSNFCRNCGDRLAGKGWRSCLRGAVCLNCAKRPGVTTNRQTLVGIGLVAVAAFSFGRYLRPAPAPLIIQRAANSPLSDAPLNLNGTAGAGRNDADAFVSSANATTTDEAAYICGARTKKGTPCRRRVQAAGERCFQHKERPAMVPLDKLVIKSDHAKK